MVGGGDVDCGDVVCGGYAVSDFGLDADVGAGAELVLVGGNHGDDGVCVFFRTVVAQVGGCNGCGV